MTMLNYSPKINNFAIINSLILNDYQMIKKLLSLIIITTLFSCKDSNETKVDDEVKIETEENADTELTEAQKIANAYGYENWKNVEEIDFAFNVQRNEGEPFKRSWTWNPNSGDVTMMTATDTVSYNRNSMDSLSMKTDQSFINDKYWLLTPYQLVWDTGTTFSEPTKVKAPMDSLMMNKITVTYGNEGGYTPGDAYDLYYGDDYKVKQWVYRKGNAGEPSMATTWENPETINGLTLVKDYNNPTSGTKIFFTDLDVKMKDSDDPK
ncbi:hypothetical protein SAMN03097699_1967 [Flavobacteriaceae bacterium MAR_2010_188]|nr:hypothetical protein SAMN03097699_1967 [Flavobacteriaceae bacterium MAR_2010_188]